MAGSLDKDDFVSETTPLLARPFDEPTAHSGASQKRAQLCDAQVEDDAEVRSVPSVAEAAHWRCALTGVFLYNMCERLVYYGLHVNMVIFCTNVLLFDSATAVSINLIFTGVCFGTPVIGGALADTVGFRYNFMHGCNLLYLMTVFLVAATAVNYTEVFGDPQLGMRTNYQRAYYLIGIFGVSIATGGVKSNILTYGAQQVEPLGQAPIKVYFYGMLWFTLMGRLLNSTIGAYVQQQIGFGLGYMILFIAMILLAVMAFVSPKSKYRNVRAEAYLYSNLIKVPWHALARRFSKSQSADLSCTLDYAKDCHGGRFSVQEVDELHSLCSLIPIYLTLIVYWMGYYQMFSLVILQGERMDLKLGGITLPVASVQVAYMVTALLLIPFLDRLIKPLLARCGLNLTSLVQMGIGMMFGVLSLTLTGVLEIVRKKLIQQQGALLQDVAGVVYTAAPLSVLYQLPLYGLLGVSDVFVMASSNNFAFTEAPSSMKALISGLSFIPQAIGNFLGAAILNIITKATVNDPWFPHEINDGHLEWFLFLLAGLLLIAIVGFTLLARRYTYSERGADTIDGRGGVKTSDEDHNISSNDVTTSYQHI